MKRNCAQTARRHEMTIPSVQQSVVHREDVRRGQLKRTFDIVLALTAIMLLSPLLVGLALAIKLSDGGPALFGQSRIGAHGRPFRILKSRAMVPNAAARLLEHLERDPEAKLEWLAARKLKRDPRITSLGRVLRKHGADDLPQMFNIPTGDMRFAGPCPIDGRTIRRTNVRSAISFAAGPD